MGKQAGVMRDAERIGCPEMGADAAELLRTTR